MDFNINLITEAYVKSASTLYSNVNWSLISPSIRQAQKYLLSAIGTGLMNELQTQVQASAVTSDNQTLLDQFVLPVLLNYLIFESADFIHIRQSPTGFQVMQPMDSNPANTSQLEMIKNAHKRRAEDIVLDMRKFLVENYATYPLYNNPGTGYDTIYPESPSNDIGIWLG